MDNSLLSKDVVKSSASSASNVEDDPNAKEIHLIDDLDNRDYRISPLIPEISDEEPVIVMNIEEMFSAHLSYFNGFDKLVYL